MSEKFNFSKLTSREEAPCGAARAAARAATPSLEVVKAEASKAAAGASGNPIQQSDLLSSLLAAARWPAHDPERHQPRARGCQ